MILSGPLNKPGFGTQSVSPNEKTSYVIERFGETLRLSLLDSDGISFRYVDFDRAELILQLKALK